MQIAYWRRFVPQLTTLRGDLADGKYGAVHFLVCSQWDEAPPPLSFRHDSGGIYIDMGVHEIDQTLWLLGQDFTGVKTQVFPTTEDTGAQNDVDSAQALVMLSGGTSTVISLGRFYEGGDIVSVGALRIQGATPVSTWSRRRPVKARSCTPCDCRRRLSPGMYAEPRRKVRALRKPLACWSWRTG